MAFLLAATLVLLFPIWILPVCNEELITFLGTISPHLLPTETAFVPITWNVSVKNCKGCYREGKPVNPSIYIRNGNFYIDLKRHPKEHITELELTISSMMDIPEKKKGENRHRTFTWKLKDLKEPDFDKVHHFQFGHFLPTKQHGLFLEVKFKKSLPKEHGAAKVRGGPKVKYYIVVARNKKRGETLKKLNLEGAAKVLGIKEWWFENTIYETGELNAEEMEGGPIKLQFVKPQPADGPSTEVKKKKKYRLDRFLPWNLLSWLKNKEITMEERLLKHRSMHVYVRQEVVCAYAKCEEKGENIYKLRNCEHYFHKKCVEKYLKEKREEMPKGETSRQYKCPLCAEGTMAVTLGKGTEKDQAIFDENNKMEPIWEFFYAHLETPLLQNGDVPKHVYEFDYTNQKKVDNYHNEVEKLEATAQFKLELLTDLKERLKIKEEAKKVDAGEGTSVGVGDEAETEAKYVEALKRSGEWLDWQQIRKQKGLDG